MSGGGEQNRLKDQNVNMRENRQQDQIVEDEKEAMRLNCGGMGERGQKDQNVKGTLWRNKGCLVNERQVLMRSDCAE